MVNLREQAEQDLSFTLEGAFALPVELVSPDPVTTQSLSGQVLYDHVALNPDTGGEMVVKKPVVVLRKSSLTRVPQPGEAWIVRIPTTPSTTAPLVDFVITSDNAPELNDSIGFIRLFLEKVVQAEES
jgi:hypothetical protein